MRLTEKEQAMLNGSGKLSALSVWYRSAGGISL